MYKKGITGVLDGYDNNFIGGYRRTYKLKKNITMDIFTGMCTLY